MPLQILKHEFLAQVLKNGSHPGMGKKLRGWLEAFHQAGNRPFWGKGRRVNPFSIEIEVSFPDLPYRLYGPGVLSCGKNLCRIRSCRSRDVGEVVASYAVAQGALSLATPNAVLSPVGHRVFVNRIGGDRVREFLAVERLERALVEARGILGGVTSGTGQITPFGYVLDLKSIARSPWTMFLVLTLVKLVVSRPGTMEGVSYDPTERIKNVLAWFKGLDDDAYTALVGLNKFGLAGPPNFSWPPLIGEFTFNSYMPRSFEPQNVAVLRQKLEGHSVNWTIKAPKIIVIPKAQWACSLVKETSKLDSWLYDLIFPKTVRGIVLRSDVSKIQAPQAMGDSWHSKVVSRLDNVMIIPSRMPIKLVREILLKAPGVRRINQSEAETIQSTKPVKETRSREL